MTIADKLLRAKTDYDEVYYTAYGQGKGTGIEQGYEEGYEVGKQAEYDAFWDAYQDNGNRTDYSNCFSGRGWTEETFKPKYDIIVTNAYMLFRYCAITNIEEALKKQGVKIYIAGGAMSYSFNNMTTKIAGEIYFTAPVTKLDSTFAYNSYLEELNFKILVSDDSTYNNVFDGCRDLREVRFEGTIGQNGLSFKDSKKLSKTSIENIISALSTTTTGLTVTLSKTAVETAFGSTTSSEWTTLIGTRSNWTISLA